MANQPPHKAWWEWYSLQEFLRNNWQTTTRAICILKIQSQHSLVSVFKIICYLFRSRKSQIFGYAPPALGDEHVLNLDVSSQRFFNVYFVFIQHLCWRGGGSVFGFLVFVCFAFLCYFCIQHLCWGGGGSLWNQRPAGCLWQIHQKNFCIFCISMFCILYVGMFIFVKRISVFLYFGFCVIRRVCSLLFVGKGGNMEVREAEL